MKYTKIIIMLALTIFIFGAASVCAGDVNDTAISSGDTGQIDLSANNEMDTNNLQINEENDRLTLADNDESISAQTDTKVLSVDENSTYSELSYEISQSGNVKLTHKNYVYDDGGSINIREDNKVIDGNGAVIDMAESNIRAFTVSASDVTIKNLTIKNANYNENGGAIYFSSSGTVTNCNFTDNQATGDPSYGGAVYFEGTGTVTNCNFKSNNANHDGGAIRMQTGNVTNCNFTDNQATGYPSYGGAVYFEGTGTVTNCNFKSNNAKVNGGAIRMQSGNVTNCNFTDNKATGDPSFGGAVYFEGTGTVQIVILKATMQTMMVVPSGCNLEM